MLTPTIRAPARTEASAIPAPTLPKPSIGDRGAGQRAAAVGERGLRGRLDAVARGEVVHVDALVALRPQRQRTLQLVREVGRERAHVGPGQEHLAVGLERPPVGGEDLVACAAGEPHACLRARVGHAPDGELPRHRAREARHLVDVHVRQHPRPARRDRELVMVDDHEGLQAVALVAKLDHPHAVSLVRAEGRTQLGGPPPRTAGCDARTSAITSRSPAT